VTTEWVKSGIAVALITRPLWADSLPLVRQNDRTIMAPPRAPYMSSPMWVPRFLWIERHRLVYALL
jgi:hypothetical protein